ncbi:uncharacterized protein BDV14DRAFT_201684 [Aspergillus stella-maris]|uniref:uncharacterized protein n=1 Tax=Aspergillus stella-maris TaxID=1810926 RepID=UPI003CCDD38B
MSVVDAIGVISGVLTMVSFAQSNFADTTEPGSTIKVAVALDGEGGTDNAGGDLPDVRVFNDFGEFKNMVADPGTVGDGTVGTIEVDHEQQGVYSLFSANNDAICIAWVTTTWSDAAGGNKFAVSGDYGEACGGTWYESNMWTNTDNSYQPKCFWVDGDGDQPNTGFQVRWPRYGADMFDEGNTDPQSICNDIDFGLRTESDPSVVNFWVDAKKRDLNSRRTRARVNRKRAAWTATELVVSDSQHHSATKLCQSETSMGPDFVHHGENLFCDMENKIPYPICGGGANSTATCFDMESHNLVEGGPGGFVKRANPYTKVRNWTSKV